MRRRLWLGVAVAVVVVLSVLGVLTPTRYTLAPRRPASEPRTPAVSAASVAAVSVLPIETVSSRSHPAAGSFTHVAQLAEPASPPSPSRATHLSERINESRAPFADHDAVGQPRGGADEGARWFYEQRAYPFDKIPTDAYAKAWVQDAALRATHSRRKGGQADGGGGDLWTSTGPAPILRQSIFYSPKLMPWGTGRVRAVAVHPGDPNVLYVGAASGGVWKSTDRGSSWSALTDTQCSLWTGAIALDPVNPEIVYVGTGESYSLGGCGVLRSADGGFTWSSFGASTFTGGHIWRVVVDPATAGSVTMTRVYVASQFGLFRSDDSGQTWTRLAPVLEYTEAWELLVDPRNSQVLYCAISTGGNYGLGVLRSGILKSIDGGSTWTSVTQGLPNMTSVGRVVMAIAPSLPDTV